MGAPRSPTRPQPPARSPTWPAPPTRPRVSLFPDSRPPSRAARARPGARWRKRRRCVGVGLQTRTDSRRQTCRNASKCAPAWTPEPSRPTVTGPEFRARCRTDTAETAAVSRLRDIPPIQNCSQHSGLGVEEHDCRLMRSQSVGDIGRKHTHELGAECGRFGHARGHDPKKRRRRADLHDGAHRLVPSRHRKNCMSAPLHGLDEVPPSAETARTSDPVKRSGISRTPRYHRALDAASSDVPDVAQGLARELRPGRHRPV